MHHSIDRQAEALQVILPGLKDVTINERITRERVTKAEERIDSLEALATASVRDRLLWLLTGTLPDDLTHAKAPQTSSRVETLAEQGAPEAA